MDQSKSILARKYLTLKFYRDDNDFLGTRKMDQYVLDQFEEIKAQYQI